jgi:addiction module HigA family antidote
LSAKAHFIHPGTVLRDDIIPQSNLTVGQIALALDIPFAVLEELLAERRPLTADLCLRIAKLFGSNAEMLMNLQSKYDLAQARKNPETAANLKRIEQWKRQPAA